MTDFFKAFVEFLSDVFAALADFLGWTVNLDDLTTAPTETPTEAPTEAPTAAPAP